MYLYHEQLEKKNKRVVCNKYSIPVIFNSDLFFSHIYISYRLAVLFQRLSLFV
jgi:hypothetical protein